jgi:hypothetical protein
MAYAIFEVKKENASIVEALKRDDVVSRQSLWTRDAASLGTEGEGLFVKITGDEEAVKKAAELVGDKGTLLAGDKKERINAKFIEDEEKANEGMGFVFG